MDGKKIFQANVNQKNQGLASDKTDFKNGKKRKTHYIMIKGSIHQEDITVVNICTANMRAPKYIKQKLTANKK